MRSPWVIKVGHKSNDIYTRKREREGYFTMFGIYFWPRKHKKMEGMKGGTISTVRKTLIYSIRVQTRGQRFVSFDINWEHTCEESQRLCWALYGHKRPQNAISTHFWITNKC